MPSKLIWLAAALAATVFGQERGERGGLAARQRIDVQSYAINAQIDPQAQTISATAQVTFVPADNTSTVSFELNNALNLTRVTDTEGRQIPASRLQEDMSVRVSLPQPLAKGKPATLVFVYGGKLTGEEESPVFGIKFAAIHPDFAYLMYPARWFPVNDYTVDRFSSDLKVTVPDGYHVIACGNGTKIPGAAGMTTEHFEFTQASFPGSLAVVKGDPHTVSSSGVSTQFYMHQSADMEGAYGDEIARAMTYLTSVFGLPTATPPRASFSSRPRLSGSKST
jgi:hypothetical protein